MTSAKYVHISIFKPTNFVLACTAKNRKRVLMKVFLNSKQYCALKIYLYMYVYKAVYIHIYNIFQDEDLKYLYQTNAHYKTTDYPTKFDSAPSIVIRIQMHDVYR